MEAAKILIVEDELSVRAYLQHILVEAGYQVSEAESGEAALEILKTQKFALLLLDLYLTGIDGLRVFREIRRYASDMVVIILTGYASLTSAVEALRLGAHDYFIKPSSPDELRESVARGLQKYRQQQRQREILSQLQTLALNTKEDHLLDEPPQTNRKTPTIVSETKPEEELLKCGDMVIDSWRHVVIYRSMVCNFSPTEFKLLAYLARHSPNVVSAQQIAQNIREKQLEDWQAEEIVRYHVYRIRQKIKAMAGDHHVIRNMRGYGYMLVG